MECRRDPPLPVTHGFLPNIVGIVDLLWTFFEFLGDSADGGLSSLGELNRNQNSVSSGTVVNFPYFIGGRYGR